MSALRMMSPPSSLVLALVLVVTLAAPGSARPQETDAVVLEAAPAALLPPVTSSQRRTAAGTRRGFPQQQDRAQLGFSQEPQLRFSQEPQLRSSQEPQLGFSQEPQLRSSQGPEGFAYESSHPVLDAYGELSTATQYHAQDGLGRYRYSFTQPGAAREEYVDENGRIQGSYSYDLPDAEPISMTYFADETGFHVKRAVLPNLAALAPQEEPDVAAIKAAHMRLWRRMWARAAAASVGAPLDPLEVTEESYEPESPSSLESDIISSDPADDPLAEEDFFAPPSADEDVPIEADPAEEEELVPIFPGGPDAPSVPVSSAPKPLPSGAGLTSPDSETVVISARIGEFSAPGGGRPQQQFQSRPLERSGALRLRDAARAPAELGFFTAAASAPVPTQVRARDADSAPAPPPFRPSRGSQSAATLRVSDEASRAGFLPVGERHSLAQVRPSQRRTEDETAPVLDNPVLYYYADLLHATRQVAAPPRIVVV